MKDPRTLTIAEKRLLADGLRAVAGRARAARSHALSDAKFGGRRADQQHLDALAERAHDAERLAAEVLEHEVRLEKVPS